MPATKETKRPDAPEGVNFKRLLERQVGKNYEEITSADVENWAAKQGWNKQDTNRVVRGFNKFSKYQGDFVFKPGMTEFEVAGSNASGRRTGNNKGRDIGDIFGTGRDVSTFAGALSTTFDIGSPTSITAKDVTKGTKSKITGPSAAPSGQAAQQAAAQSAYNFQKSVSPKGTSDGTVGTTKTKAETSLLPNSPFVVQSQYAPIKISSPENVSKGMTRAFETSYGVNSDRAKADAKRKAEYKAYYDSLSPAGKKWEDINRSMDVFDAGQKELQRQTGLPTFNSDNLEMVTDALMTGLTLLAFKRPIMGATSKITGATKNILTKLTNKSLLKNLGKVQNLPQTTQKLLPEAAKVIPESKWIPQTAESLKNTFITPISSTRVGNVGFRPKIKINRLGGKISKFSK